jgi:hypothetical protein
MVTPKRTRIWLTLEPVPEALEANDVVTVCEADSLAALLVSHGVCIRVFADHAFVVVFWCNAVVCVVVWATKYGAQCARHRD